MKDFNQIEFLYPPSFEYYKGKVRDVLMREKCFISIATDRISAFDCILPKTIPYKGQVLNGIAAYFLSHAKNILPIWLTDVPHPNVSIGKKCEPIKIEMVIRGYLSGHAWREYQAGKRILCGVELPNNMKANDAFIEPIITPSTKADIGHDEDISKNEILSRGLVSKEIYQKLENYTHQLFEQGRRLASQNGLILVDTKYEFGLFDGEITLMDEIHTPDSSRYYEKNEYDSNQSLGLKQNQLSKEFVREWLILNNFMGQPHQTIPEMNLEFIELVSEKYISLFEKITGQNFIKSPYEDLQSNIKNSLADYLN